MENAKLVKWAMLILLMSIMVVGYGGQCDLQNKNDSGSSPAPAPIVTTPDITAPSVPTGLSANAVSSSQINLTWNASSDAVGVTGYYVYRNSSYVGASSTTSYSDTGLSPSTNYTYTVAAYDAAGNSAQSSQASATTSSGGGGDTTAPTVPTGLSANAVSSSQINLTWNASSDAVGVTGYNIYRNGTYLTSVAGTSYNNTGLSPSTTYNYTVEALDAAGNPSAQSSQASATTQAGVTVPDQVGSPTPSNGLTGVSTSQQLSWASASGATSYDVYFGTSSPGTFIVNQAGVSYDPGVLSYNTTYYWRINSKNSAGTTSGLVWSFTTLSPPPKVTLVSPSNGSTGRPTSQQIDWASASGATSYDVYFGTSSPGTYKTNTTATIYNPGTLADYTWYYWRINSKNAAGTTTGDVWSFRTAPESGTVTFNCTGAVQYFTVPAGVNWITVDARGAQGGHGYYGSTAGGNGARVQVMLSVTPGDFFYIYVGGQGGTGGINSAGTGGYNLGGAGAGYYGGGGGGGRSSMTIIGNSNTVYAGGGGGSGGRGAGGTGGENGGYSGTAQGGFQFQGGGGGSGYNGGNSGSTGSQSGGTGGSGTIYGGGGGGAGYYGGGGGGGSSGTASDNYIGGGGGGSSYSTGNPTFTSGYQSGNGQIIITY